jgi:hypothetical protein
MEALEMARRSDDRAVLVQVIQATEAILSTPDRRAEFIADIHMASRLADELGDPYLRAACLNWVVPAYYRSADIAGVDATIAEHAAVADALGLPFARWQHSLLVAGRLVSGSQTDLAETANNESLELGIAAGVPEALGVFGGILYSIRDQQGRLDEIIDLYLDAARDNPSIAVLRASASVALCQVGRLEEARERLQAEATTHFDFPYDGTMWTGAMSYLADTAAILGDRGAARTLLELLAPFESEVICPAIFHEGAVARTLGRLATVLGDHDRAERWFATAHDIHTRLEAPYWMARGQLDHADLCLTRRGNGDIERARELVTSAASTATEFGCAGLTKRAAAILTEL